MSGTGNRSNTALVEGIAIFEPRRILTSCILLFLDKFPSESEIRWTNGIIDLGRNAIDQSLSIGLGQLGCLNALVKAGVYLVNGAEGLADLVGDNCGLIGGVITS